MSKVVIDGGAGKRTVLKEGFPDGPVAVTAVGTTAYVLEGQLGMRGPAGATASGPKPFRRPAWSWQAVSVTRFGC